MRIVFAEDQALLRKGLTLVLTDLGYEVVEVDNGPALVAALADPDVDGAVVDVRLPPSQTTWPRSRSSSTAAPQDPARVGHPARAQCCADGRGPRRERR